MDLKTAHMLRPILKTQGVLPGTHFERCPWTSRCAEELSLMTRTLNNSFFVSHFSAHKKIVLWAASGCAGLPNAKSHATTCELRLGKDCNTRTTVGGRFSPMSRKKDQSPVSRTYADQITVHPRCVVELRAVHPFPWRNKLRWATPACVLRDVQKSY